MNFFSKETVPDSFLDMSKDILKSDAVKQDTVRGSPAARFSIEQRADYRHNQIITADMTDSERTEIIRKKKITVPAYAGEADNMMANEPDLMVGKTAMIKAALQRIADEFKDLTDYHIEDVDVSFTLSKSNLKESLSKDADAVQIAKLMPVMKMAVEKAVGIESHDNRYFFDNNIVRFDNLIGGYVEGDLLIPIRFGLKHSISGKATLYVVVDQDGVPIKKQKQRS